MRFKSVVVILAIISASCGDSKAVTEGTPVNQLEEFYSGGVRLGGTVANALILDSTMTFQPYRGYSVASRASQHGLVILQLVTGESLQPEGPPTGMATVSAVLFSGDSVDTRAVAARTNQAFGVPSGETECREISGIGRFRISKWTSPTGNAALLFPDQAGARSNARFILTTSFDVVPGVQALLQPGKLVACTQ